MKKKRQDMKKIMMWVCFACMLLTACSGGKAPDTNNRADTFPVIFPDYTEVTLPPNIAPLHFGLQDSNIADAWACFACGNTHFEVKMQHGTFAISSSKWRKLLQVAASEGAIEVEVLAAENGKWTAYKPFHLYVSSDPIDDYLAYRRIAPGYQLWKGLGIYQRELATYDESVVLKNRQTDENCMNCHSFCNRQPDHFLFHMRQKWAGTYIVNGDKIEKLDTKIEQTGLAFTYPSWHPDGRFVAFSSNDTRQLFHSIDKNRIEVYDLSSDVLVYDTERHEALTTEALFSKENFETFPTFSPDGKRLYFCTAQARKLPTEFREVKYSLCSIAFDPATRTFGSEVDTLYSAPTNGKSVSFPRISPDGRYLMYTLSDYGNFSIWHKDADLYLYDMKQQSHRCLTEVNSDDVESYHSWSSNSRWFVFSSRRMDGLYTRPFFAHISADGRVSKPFVLPQSRRCYYDDCMESFNIPELVSGKVTVRPRQLVDKSKEPAVGITVREQ